MGLFGLLGLLGLLLLLQAIALLLPEELGGVLDVVTPIKLNFCSATGIAKVGLMDHVEHVSDVGVVGEDIMGFIRVAKAFVGVCTNLG